MNIKQNEKVLNDLNFPNWKNDCSPNSNHDFQKKLKYHKTNFNSKNSIRINKYLANAGLCSRREADKCIQAGLVKINGTLVTELRTRVNYTDSIKFNDSPIRSERKVYILLNKPKNCMTTTYDPQGRFTIMDLVKTTCKEQIFPVGRLDRNTTGVLLLTNDGELSDKLTHPKYVKKKIYHVWLNRIINTTDMQRLSKGIQLKDGEIRSDNINYINGKDRTQVNIEIHSGRNHIVHRMFENIGYCVVKLDRVYFAGLTKKNLKRGQWRFLNNREITMLRMKKFD